MAVPRSRSLSEIKNTLLHPATTNHFVVSIPKPQGLTTQYLFENGVSYDIDKLELLCSDALLPGSTFATHDITGDYHGSTHRHAYRRQYDDRIDLGFYVDATNYLPIRFFEVWMKYISGEQIASAERGRPGVSDEQYFYRMNWPKNYICNQGLEVIKFEKSSMGQAIGAKGTRLSYNFVNCFPIAMQSMPVSYDGTGLLKCNVSLSYVRYFLSPASPKADGSEAVAQGASDNPINQAQANAALNGGRDDLAIWALSNRQMVESVGTAEQRAILADANLRFPVGSAAREALRNRARSGTYSAGTGGAFKGRPINGPLGF